MILANKTNSIKISSGAEEDKSKSIEKTQLGLWLWSKNNIQVFLDKRNKEIDLGVQFQNIKSKSQFADYILMTEKEHKQLQINRRKCPFFRYVMLDFPIESLKRTSTSYIETPPGYQTDCVPKHVSESFALGRSLK